MVVRQIPVNRLAPDPVLPERWTDDDSIAVLADELTRNGLHRPLVVRSDGSEGWWVMCGRRLLQAALRLGWATIPCSVREATDLEALHIAISDDSGHEQRPAIEVAWRTARLVEEETRVREWGAQTRAAQQEGVTRQRVNQRMGVARAFPREALEAAGVPLEHVAKMSDAALRRAAQSDDPIAGLTAAAGLAASGSDHDPPAPGHSMLRAVSRLAGARVLTGGVRLVRRWGEGAIRFVKRIYQIWRAGLTTGPFDPTR